MAKMKSWEELTISDNFLFLKVMQDKRICKRLLEKILNINISEVYYPETEKSIDVSAVSKSVRLDVFVKTETGMTADIEKFLAYVNGQAAEGEFTKDIAAEVKRIKEHEETRLEYMTLMMELKQQRREGFAEGHAMGIRSNQISNALSMLADHLPLDKVAQYSQLSVQEATELGRKHGYL